MTADLSSLWSAVTFSFVVVMLTLAFAVYQAQKGVVPGQREAMAAMQTEIEKQRLLVDSLQQRSNEQWMHMQEQERKLKALAEENVILKKQTHEQQLIIDALQRQLAGLARGQKRNSAKLRSAITRTLDENELRQWAFDLGIPFENLTGTSKDALVISMLELLERHGRLEEGLSQLRTLRPDIPLDEVL